jgi:hypothetical protein
MSNEDDVLPQYRGSGDPVLKDYYPAAGQHPLGEKFAGTPIAEHFAATES